MPKYYVSCKEVELFIVIQRDDAEKAAIDALKRFRELHPNKKVEKGVVSVSEIGMLKAEAGNYRISSLLQDEDSRKE